MARRLSEVCIRCKERPADHRHHRKLRSQGGDNSEANLIPVCFLCHDWIHRNPAKSYEAGLMVKSWQNPEDVPVA